MYAKGYVLMLEVMFGVINNIPPVVAYEIFRAIEAANAEFEI